jgi:hypothetical protein
LLDRNLIYIGVSPQQVGRDGVIEGLTTCGN